MKKRQMFTFAILLATLPLFTSCNGAKADNTLTQEQEAEGWALLFDGISLNGWSIHSGYATYKVEDGAIVGTTATGSPNTFLCSDGEFSDFELEFDVRFDDKFFNSGIQIRSKLRGTAYGGRVYGPQVEIEKSPGQAGFIYGEAAGAWQSPEPESDDESVSTHEHFLNDGWNHYRILAVGRRIQTWINGTQVADLLYDKGRYMDNPEGFIGLQVHSVGDDEPEMSVRWKNIRIRQMKAEADGATALFNGKDFEGWKFHLGKEGADNSGSFLIADGIISTPGDPRGYMYTEKSYTSYIIKYDWKFDRPADLHTDSLFKGNSGCLIHVGEANALGVWPVSIEVQGKHNQAGLILPIPRSVKCDFTYDRDAYREAINPVGEWSTMTVEVDGADMIIRVNGAEVSMVKESELTSGPIALQSEGAPISWKNIKILVL